MLKQIRYHFSRNLILQYSVVTLVIILTLSALLAAFLSRYVKDYLTETHIQFYPKIIHGICTSHPGIYEFLDKPSFTEIPADVKTLVNEILTYENIFRVKLWDRNGTILWSDKKEIIGKNFATNKEFQKAIRGTIAFSAGKPVKRENVAERQKRRLLEIYTPIIKEGKTVGVFEIYEDDEALYESIQKSVSIFWFFVISFGVFLYASQFFIFYRSYRSQNRSYKQLEQSENATIFALAYQAELRDRTTGRHLKRASLYVKLLAEELSRDHEYRSYITPQYINDLMKSAPLHDIGKVSVPDIILGKQGPLTPEEFEIVKQHCKSGAEILKKADEQLDFRSFLKLAKELVLSHHERWDGKGYPSGLKGEEIPLSGRIMALADVYDALRSERPYKKSFSHQKSSEIIKSESSGYFDPKVVAAFFKCEKEFAKVSEDLAD